MPKPYGWGFKPLPRLFKLGWCNPAACWACILAVWVQLPVLALAANEQYAVVRILSHGASATVIDTGPGYTWLLGCGHAYEGADRSRPMVFDLARRVAQPRKTVCSQLLALDYRMDLSLVLLSEGPVDYVARVAPLGHSVVGHAILSCGFDEMKFPMHQDYATILRNDNGRWITREMPWHGRSGGGLIDMTSGFLIGVVQGYDLPEEFYTPRSHTYDPLCHGLYVDLKTIQRFLQNYATKRGLPSTPQQRQFSQPLQPLCPP
jgi:hypothetical protein